MTYDHDNLWADNWSQTQASPRWPGTDTSIQGVMCCIDADESISWLLMLCDVIDGKPVTSYIATSFRRGDELWPWCWIHASSFHEAISRFAAWVESADLYPPADADRNPQEPTARRQVRSGS
jgi:hypothetical protein